MKIRNKKTGQIIDIDPADAQNYGLELPEAAKGGMIKRADGSYSRRGLWDNIRANRGSGKKPTKEMLKQEKKIRAAEKAYGGYMQMGGNMTFPIDNLRTNLNYVPIEQTMIPWKLNPEQEKIADYLYKLNAGLGENKEFYRRAVKQKNITGKTKMNPLDFFTFKPQMQMGGGLIDPFMAYGGMYAMGGMYPMGGYIPMDMMAQGGINNPGFRALPDYVQQNIIDNMATGGCMECGGRMAEGGKLPTEILRARLEAHMSPNEAQDYINSYAMGGYFDQAAEGKWIQKATASIKRRGTEGVCTGSKFGGPGCPPGSKRYNLAKTFRKMAKSKKKQTGGYVENEVYDITPEEYQNLLKAGYDLQVLD